MLFFVLKKMFFDMWDNLIAIILLNMCILLLVSLFFLPISIFATLHPMFLFLYIVIGLFIFNFLLGAIVRYTLEISDYKKPGFKDFFSYFGQTWKFSIINSLISIILVSIAIFVLPFYFVKGLIEGSLISAILFGVVFWTSITILLTSGFFLPISLRINKGIIKNIRNSFLIFFDNTAFSIYAGIISLILTVLSIFLLPGFATASLWMNVCLKIRLYKYDYIEANPDANRKKIPWKELILEDKKRVGKRTLRGMIFPWKE